MFMWPPRREGSSASPPGPDGRPRRADRPENPGDGRRRAPGLLAEARRRAALGAKAFLHGSRNVARRTARLFFSSDGSLSALQCPNVAMVTRRRGGAQRPSRRNRLPRRSCGHVVHRWAASVVRRHCNPYNQKPRRPRKIALCNFASPFRSVAPLDPRQKKKRKRARPL